MYVAFAERRIACQNYSAGKSASASAAVSGCLGEEIEANSPLYFFV
jgi:ribosomal protein S12 methylthiotransferase accessory factor YcaO